jgi:hypothetical protein
MGSPQSYSEGDSEKYCPDGIKTPVIQSKPSHLTVLSPIIQFNSVLYFNVLTQQLQEPITESAQEDEIYT